MLVVKLVSIVPWSWLH